MQVVQTMRGSKTKVRSNIVFLILVSERDLEYFRVTNGAAGYLH